MAAATATKPRGPRTIVNTKLIAGGALKHTMTKPTEAKLRDARELLAALKSVPDFKDNATAADEALGKLLGDSPA